MLSALNAKVVMGTRYAVVSFHLVVKDVAGKTSEYGRLEMKKKTRSTTTMKKKWSEIEYV